MSRIAFLVGAGVILAALTYFTPLLPDTPALEFSWGVIPVVQVFVGAFGVVAGALLFDIAVFGLRSSILVEAGTVALVRTRSFVSRALNPLAEVQRTGRGTVGIPGI